MHKIGPLLNKLFGTAYIKNLPNSIERKRGIIEQCNIINLNFFITQAANGIELVNEDFTLQHGRFFLQYPSSAGYLGNQLTTFRQIKNAIQNNLSSLILLDDDCMFEHTQKLNITEYSRIERELPSDWDIIILGEIGITDLTNKTIHYMKATVHGQAMGSHAVAIRNTVYKDILIICKEMRYLGDGIIGRMIDIGKNVYIIRPTLCYQNPLYFSDINKCFKQ